MLGEQSNIAFVLSAAVRCSVKCSIHLTILSRAAPSKAECRRAKLYAAR